MRNDDDKLDYDELEDAEDPLGGAQRAGLADELPDTTDESLQQQVGAREGGPPRRKDLSVVPDELGRRYLENATQQPQQIDELDDTEREGTGELPIATMGERYMREQSPEAGDGRDRLVTRMPDRSEHEARISRLTRASRSEKDQ